MWLVGMQRGSLRPVTREGVSVRIFQCSLSADEMARRKDAILTDAVAVQMRATLWLLVQSQPKAKAQAVLGTST